MIRFNFLLSEAKHNDNVGAREPDGWVKCLLCKHEEWSSDLAPM